MLLTEQSVRERNDRLEEEVAFLKSELGIVKDKTAETAFATRWGLTGKEAKILSHLYQKKGGLASRDGVMLAVYQGSPDEPEQKIVDVFMCKIRRKIGRDIVETIWGRGWRLTPHGVEVCAGLVGTPLSEIERAGDDERSTLARYQSYIGLKALRAIGADRKTNRQVADALGINAHRTHSLLRTLRAKGLVERVDAYRNERNVLTNVHGLTAQGHLYLAARKDVDADVRG